MFALERWQPGAADPTFLNVGTGVDLTIRALSEAVAAEATGYQGEILWVTSKPDGTPPETPGCEPSGELGLAGPHPPGSGPGWHSGRVPRAAQPTAGAGLSRLFGGRASGFNDDDACFKHN